MQTQVELVEPQKMRRLRKGGTLASRQAILHSLVNTESWAVDLSWCGAPLHEAQSGVLGMPPMLQSWPAQMLGLKGTGGLHSFLLSDFGLRHVMLNR